MALNLQVDIDPKAGFCFGVKKTIAQAEEILSSRGLLYCLGEIVHNQEEVKRLEDLGMVTISHDEINQLRGVDVLIRAHGEPPETYQLLLDQGNRVHEATCPIVLKLQDRIKDAAANEKYVLIYGKATHPEVIGLLGQNPSRSQAFIDPDMDLNWEQIPKEVFLYSQTTMDVAGLNEAKSILAAKGLEVTVKNTICGQVSNRKPSLERFAADKDVVIFVAGKTSSNGKVLFNHLDKVHTKSYFVSSKEDLNVDWFLSGYRVGISGATSTPQWLMIEIQKYLVSL